MPLTEPVNQAIPVPAVGTSQRPAAASRVAGPGADAATLAAGAGISLAGKLVGRGVHIVSQILLARLLGPAAFGLYAIGWTLLRVVGVIAPLGLDRGVVRFGSRSRGNDPAALRGMLLHSLGLAIAAGAVLGAGFYLAAPWLAGSVFGEPGLVPVLRLFALAFPLYTGLRVAAAATRVTQRMQFSALAEELAPPVGNLSLIVLFYVLGWHLLGAVAAGVVSFGLAFALALYYVRRLFPQALAAARWPAASLTGELMRFSLPASWAGVFAMMTLWVDRLLVAYFRPAADVGVYQAASQSAILFALILSGFNAVCGPLIADLYQQDKRERVEELFRLTTRWTLSLCLPVFLVLCFASQPFMTVVFGETYAAGWAPLVILAAAQLVNAGTGPVGLLLTMTGKQDCWFRLSGTMLLVNVALNVWLIPQWGITGAALATAVAISGLFLLALVEVKRRLRFWPYDRRTGKCVGAAGLTAGALALVAGMDVGSPAGNLAARAAIALVVFVAALRKFGWEAADEQLVALVRAKARGVGSRTWVSG